jgi:phage gp29-like protein
MLKKENAIDLVKKTLAKANKRKHLNLFSGWDESSVSTAIENQLKGDFSGTSRLARTMMQDETYSAAIEKRVNSLIRTELLFEDASKKSSSIDEDASVRKIIAESISELWFKTVPESVIKKLLESYLNVGIGLGFIEWNLVDGVWAPSIIVYDTDNLKWDTSKCQLYYQGESKTEFIEPGNGNWIVVSDWQYGHVAGKASTLGKLWIKKAFTEKDWMEANQAHINNITIISDNPDGTYQEQTDIDEFVEEIQDQKVNRVIYCPAGKSIEFKDSIAGFQPQTYSEFIDRTDRKIQVSILGNNLSSEIQGGSYAASQVHYGVELNTVKSDAQILSTVFYDSVLKYLVYLNFGPTLLEYTPWLKWSLDEPEDLTSKINTLMQVKEFVGDKFEIINLQELLEPFGVKIKEKEPLV